MNSTQGNYASGLRRARVFPQAQFYKAIENLCTSVDKHPLEWIGGPSALFEQVFDCLPDVLFYIKDLEGRYLWVNKTLVERSGLGDRTRVVGKSADQLFPASGSSTIEQELELVRTERPMREQLRLYRTLKGELHWCLSSKFPILDSAQRIVGIVGLSRDLPRSNERHRSYYRLAQFLQYIDLRFDQNVRVADAAAHSSLSMDTLVRLVFEVFHLTPKQLLMKKRIDKACQLLEETDRSITEVSIACGYADHSAFTRQFRTATGVTPGMYRMVHKDAASAP